MTDAPARRESRPQVGLMLSCGEPPAGSRNYPKKLDHIRPKPGSLEQYAEAARKFTEVYGPEPRRIDVLFGSDRIGDVLDVRPKVYGTSRLKARGATNLAELEPDDFAEAIAAYDWELVTYPDARPEPGSHVVAGRDDKVVTQMGLKVYATLRVSLPKVTGLMMVTEVSTTSLRTMSNWHRGIFDALRLTGGVLVGIPFLLMLRPARTSYWDAKEKKRKASEFYEWVIDSADSLERLYEIAAERRQVLAGGAPLGELPPIRHDDPERDAELAEALWGVDEERRVRNVLGDLRAPGDGDSVREEPVGPDDSLLNRIARLEEEVGADAALVTLRGQYGVDDARELDLEDATRYADALERAAAAGAEFVESEVVEDSAPDESGDPPRSSPETGAETLLDDVAPEPEPEPEPLKGEPADGDEAREFDPVEMAGDLLVPAGRHTGKPISQMAQEKPQWVKWALRNPKSFKGEAMFVAALELYARERLPEVYAAAKGARDGEG